LFIEIIIIVTNACTFDCRVATIKFSISQLLAIPLS